MKNPTAAGQMADTLNWTLPDGRATTLTMSYTDVIEDALWSDGPSRLVATMLDAFWSELLEQE